MDKKELAQFLYDNFYCSFLRSIDLSGLDFTPFGCDVNISGMKVAAELYQSYQKAPKISQDCQQATYLYQGCCRAEKIVQDRQIAKEIKQCDLDADEIIVDKLCRYVINKYGAYNKLTPRVVNLTKKEIENLLGYKINIVEED